MLFSSMWAFLIFFHLSLTPTSVHGLDLGLDLSTPPLLDVGRVSHQPVQKRSALAQDVVDRVKRDYKKRSEERSRSEMPKKPKKSRKRSARISLSRRQLLQPQPQPQPHRFDLGDNSEDSSENGEEDGEEGNEKGEEEEEGSESSDGSDAEDLIEETTNSIALSWPKGSPDAGKTWKLPKHFTTFDAFNITQWVSKGRENCVILPNGIPTTKPKPRPKPQAPSIPATSSPNPHSASSGLTISLGGLQVSLLKRDEDGLEASESHEPALEDRSLTPNPFTNLLSGPASVIRAFYPKGSSNPGSDPVGGCQFYAATPLELSSATSVTLRYSVYFSPTFNFVMGGKLPGLYSGEGCSGGNDAQDCWSSRMMWRTNGMGELYLYVPQDKQDPAICKIPPYSECNPDYGDSIGRGSFYFTRGAWTQISQTIRLNSSPTAQDGSFNVHVNGGIPTTINFNKVLYPAAFKGIFFSTFFGGHGEEWAARKDEHTYFKDFSVTVNH